MKNRYLLFFIGIVSLSAAGWVYTTTEDHAHDIVNAGVARMRDLCATKGDIKAAFENFKVTLELEITKTKALVEATKKDYESMQAQIEALKHEGGHATTN